MVEINADHSVIASLGV